MILRSLGLVVSPDVQRILGLVKKETSFAVVAGGYLRDSYYNVKQKDIDIFVNDDVDKTKLLTSLIADGWSMDDSDESCTDYTGGHLSDIFEMTKPNQFPIQIISSSTFTSVESVLMSFDFGFCQIAYDGFGVLVSEAFWQDAANNTVTLLPGKREKSAHKKRLKLKYPNAIWNV